MNSSAFNTLPFNGGVSPSPAVIPLPDVRGTLFETAPAYVVDFAPDVFVLFQAEDEDKPEMTAVFDDP